MLKNLKLIIVLIAGLAFSGWMLSGYLNVKESPKPVRELDYYGPVTRDSTMTAEGKIKVTPRFFQIPDFSFTDHKGNPINRDSLLGKISVVDYFFTTCRSICPIMTTNIGKVAELFPNDPELRFLSHTVDPETDTQEVLNAYATEKRSVYPFWKFITADKESLYRQAREGYFLDAQENYGGEEDFIHTQNFVLVDKNGNLRGYYDGTDSADIKRLIIDIKLLKQYYAYTSANQ